MPTITFTVDGPAGKGGTARFEPRAMFEADGKLVTSWASPRLVKYTNNTPVSVVLPEGPWKVGGLSGGQPLPIDVGSVNADLKDLIVFNLPPSAPATTLSQAVAAWMDSNVNTEVTEPLVEGILANPESGARAVLDETYGRVWKASTAYAAGDLVLLPAPVNGPGTRNSNGTSRGSFDATEQGLWTPSATATVDGLTDATTVGKAVAKAASAAAARSAIGAVDSAAAAATGVLSFESFGAVGDGAADDTPALLAAVSEGAATGKLVVGSPNAIYRVTQQGTRTFRTGTGSTYTAPYCLSLPANAQIDMRGAVISVPSSFLGIAVCNDHPTAQTDKIEFRGAVIDGGGFNASRGYALVILSGLAAGSKIAMTVRNVSYIGASISWCTKTEIERLHATNIKGQGYMLGNGLSDLNDLCTFGLLTADNIQDFGSFNQPGNGYCIGATRSSINRIIQRNAAGGTKYLKGCDELHTVYSEFDGAVSTGETAYGTANSGTKIQGDDASNKTGRVTFGKIVSRNCVGSGLYVRFAGDTLIDSYVGAKNGRNGTNDDLDLGEFDDLEIGSVKSDSAGLGGFTVGPNAGLVKGGRLTVRNVGDVTAANSYCFTQLTGKLRFSFVELMDNRQTPITSKAIQAPNAVSMVFDNYRSNIGNRVDIRSSLAWLGNPILSTGNAGLTGTVTLANGATQTDVSNANSVSQAVTGGFAEPLFEITPLNAAAQALGVVRCAVPTNFAFRMFHATATGTEVFSYRIVAYVFRTTKPA
ncbi:hypothetical protein [Gordonia sp. AC31]|uniref:hypothetical protein n=1 Tax=Gordonia sp. AC31 TaxID=2962571 RepID=UPI002881D80C|nr:hypothetical protein [Gordonia sp. AC31]MDT0223452.1 hypothetical protein [Gordonia sp. AC31]